MSRYFPTRTALAAFAALCAVGFGGCASWQGPRIDPTGERLLIWPNEAPPTVVAPAVPAPITAAPGTPAIAPPPTVPTATPSAITPQAVPPGAPLPFGNVQAPPVYSDPATPPISPPPAGVAPPAPNISPGTPPSLAPATVTPAVPVVTPVAGQPAAARVPAGHEFLRLTPDRLVAPVGTQVLLKVGAVAADGYLTPNERIQWSIARTGVGQFGNMDLQSPLQFFGWWEAPEAVDSWTAVGHTAALPVTLDATSIDPNNNWHIERGETWVTVASAAEGTSQVTAYAPEQREYNQATATIYWIDAQWVFPTSVVAEPGRPHVLTTTIMRRTDRAPLAGWIVRYSVGNGASLGYEGGNATDVPTDATGRASVEVSPTGAGGGVSTVGITIIRPPSVGPNALPRVELAHSAATITWGGSAAPAAPVPAVAPSPTPIPAPVGPPPTMSGPAPPPSQPAPSLSPTSPTTTQPPPSPPPSTPTAGHPRLEINLRATSPDQVAVGDYIRYELTITNRGDGLAQHVQVVDRFDQGLSHPGDTQNQHMIKNSNIRDLPPNDSVSVPLSFRVVAPGRQCHQVAVSADGADPVSQHACVTGVQAALEVKITAPFSRVVGEVADFSVSVKNVGASAATNVELRLQCDAAIDLVVGEGMQRLSDGSLLVRLDRDLAADERRVFRFQGRCRTQSNHACARANVTALGGASSMDEACLQILPALSGTAPGSTGMP